jgi:hypothetical protein
MHRFWNVLIEVLLWVIFIASTIMGIAAAATLNDSISARAVPGEGGVITMFAAWPWFLIAVLALVGVGVMTAVDRMRFEMTGRK